MHTCKRYRKYPGKTSQARPEIAKELWPFSGGVSHVWADDEEGGAARAVRSAIC